MKKRIIRIKLQNNSNAESIIEFEFGPEVGTLEGLMEKVSQKLGTPIEACFDRDGCPIHSLHDFKTFENGSLFSFQEKKAEQQKKEKRKKDGEKMDKDNENDHSNIQKDKEDAQSTTSLSSNYYAKRRRCQTDGGTYNKGECHEGHIQLPGRTNTRVSFWNGRLSIRDYYKDKNDQQYKPSKTGICLSKEQWDFIKQHKKQIDAMFENK